MSVCQCLCESGSMSMCECLSMSKCGWLFILCVTRLYVCDYVCVSVSLCLCEFVFIFV